MKTPIHLLEAIRAKDWHSANDIFASLMQRKISRAIAEEKKSLTECGPECDKKEVKEESDDDKEEEPSVVKESVDAAIAKKLVFDADAPAVSFHTKDGMVDCKYCEEGIYIKDSSVDEIKKFIKDHKKCEPMGESFVRGTGKLVREWNDDDDEDSDEPGEDDITCDDSDGPFYYNRKKIANNPKELVAWCKRENWYPNVYSISDHGNTLNVTASVMKAGRK